MNKKVYGLKDCNCHKDSNGTLKCPVHTYSAMTPISDINDADENVKQMSEREKQWHKFSNVVSEHLREYTVPQYGDVGEDEITHYSVEDCVGHIQRYSKRYGTQSRSGQQELDFMKIAHYAQCAWEKYEPIKVSNGVRVFYTSLDAPDTFDYIGEGRDKDGEKIYIYREL